MIGNDRRSQVKPRVITTDVQIDQARRNIVARNINSCLPRGARNISVHPGYFPLQHGDIHLLINPVGQIDNVPTLEDRIVSRSLLRKSG